ncbi:hypothetical protein JNW88_14770 [Micromonospora sp. ATA32]|nr:hypothetical protein [Micromonospora sp. ATA32]
MSDQPAAGSPGPDPRDPTAPNRPTADGPTVSGPPTGDPTGYAGPTSAGPAGAGPGDPAGGGYPWDPAAPQPQVWAFPPTGGFPPGAAPGAGPYGGYPPGYPPYGGQQPGYPPYGGQPPGYPPYGGYPPGWDQGDALVNPPNAGLGGWFARCTGAVRRSWRLLVPIMLLTQAVPAAAISLLSLALDPSAKLQASAASGATTLPDGYLAGLGAYAVVVFTGGLLLGLVQALGWAAGSWAVTRQAAGEPADLAGALRYGLRRSLGLWGWTLLVGVLIGVGICFCVLPGIYLAFALSLAGPVYLFERDNPIGRSFRFFHDRLGMVLGRVALVAAVVVVGSLVAGVLESVGMAPFGVDPLASPGSAVAALVVIMVAAALSVPVYLAQLVGLLATYAEQRAHEGPVNAARLAAELG